MSSIEDKIYLHSPVWMQNLIVAGYGWWWYRRRFNPYFHRFVREYQEREHWNSFQFLQYQDEKLRNLLKISQQAPYYAKILENVDLSKNISSQEILKQIPLLLKETLRIYAKELLTQKDLPPGTIVQRSSGTTGTPTDIYYTPEFHAMELAVPESRNLNWAGVNFRKRRVMFGVRKVADFSQRQPPFWRYSPVEDMAYASIYHLSPRYLPAYLDFLRKFHPDVIMGYPSALYTIAAYAAESGNLPVPAKVVITMSETLSVLQRETIEQVWQCKVYDRYGAVEGCMFASQCEFGRYHVSPDVGILEILDKDGTPCLPGVLGEVVCTGLHNTLQPLIRYKVGDMARWAVDQTCSCGREMPIIEGIEGRFEDMCLTPDGRQMLRFDTVFKGITNIKEAQIVQEKLDLFTIYLVPTKEFCEKDVEVLKKNMQKHVGSVTIHVEVVEQLERSKSGKFRAVICKLPLQQKAEIFEQEPKKNEHTKNP